MTSVELTKRKMTIYLALGQTAGSELKRAEFVNLVVVGLGSAWLLLGVRTWMGLSEESLTNSTYARRYIGKYRNQYLAQQAHQHGDASHDGGHH